MPDPYTPPQVPYLSAGRKLCVTGSCILTASEDFVGKVIRFFEGNHAFCSHTASVVRFPAELMSEERVTLIEALEKGLTPTFISHYGAGFKGRIFLFTPGELTKSIQATPVGHPSNTQTKFSQWLLERLFEGTPYDYAGLFKQIFGHVPENTGTEFCSEAWGLAAEYAGISRIDNAHAGMAPQPADIPNWWSGTLVELIKPFE